jgi:hypothetical protein
MSTTSTITGRAAITLAETFGLTLNKHADPTDDSETRAAGISVEVAREVAKQDPGLIWLDGAAVASAVADAQIEQLRAEAAEAGDDVQVEICDVALERQELACVDTDDETAPVVAVRTAQARVMCARAIATAQAANV